MENENMTYVVDEINEIDSTDKIDLKLFLTDFEQMDINNDHVQATSDYFLAQMSEYDLNYTSKQLCIIYEYYNLGKIAKLKKADIIQAIVVFEHDEENCEIVMRRQHLWHCLEELKSDKFMKRFVWST